MMTPEDAIRNVALWREHKGPLHVQTSESGLHTDLYLNTDIIISNVPLVERIVKEIFVRDIQERNIAPDWIITYSPFRLALAYALARETGAKFGYVDIKNDSCNFNIKPGESIIVIGDDIYSGGSLKKTIDVVRKMDAKVLSPLFTIGNFSGIQSIKEIEVCSVLSEKGKLYSPDECPLCKAGSIAVLPRPNWEKLMQNGGHNEKKNAATS